MMRHTMGHESGEPLLAAPPWMCLLLVAATMPASGESKAAQGGAGPDPANAAYRIELANALPGQKTLTVYAVYEGGAGKRAFGLAKQYNAVAHKVDLADVKLEGRSLKGDLKVVVMPDHWVPKDRKPANATYSIDVTVKDGELAGSHQGRFGDLAVEGAVSGVAVADAMPAPAKVRFDFFYPFDARPRGGRPTVVLLSKDGVTWESAFVDRPSSMTHGGLYGYMDESDVRIERGVLKGRFAARHMAADGASDAYQCEVKGAVILGKAGGVLTGTVNGKDIGEWPFWGEYGPFAVSAPGQAVHRVMLHAAIPKAHMLDLALDAREGRFAGGVGVTTRNHASCDVEAQDLKLEADHVKGRIKVTVNVDDWQPTDRKPIQAEYAVDWAVKGFQLRGSFTGRAEGVEVSGPVTGFLEPLEYARPPWGATVRVAKGVKGLTGGMIFIGVEADEKGVGHLTHFPIAADVERSEFRVEADRFTGEVEGKMKQGPYQGKKLLLKFAGRTVSELGSGALDVLVDGEKVDQETLFIGVRSMPPPTGGK